MKKFLVILFMIFSFYSESFATDACDRFLPQEESFVGKVTLNARLRDFPCTYKSNILGVSTIGTNYTITQKVDGWYKVELDGGESAWIWDQAINKTNLSVIQKETTNSYNLTIKDNILINKLVFKIDELIQAKGLGIRDQLVSRINKILNEKKLSPRVNKIFEQLNIRIKNIEIKAEEEEEEEEEEEKIIDNSNGTKNYLSEYNIDLDRVKETWLDWYNTERKALGKHSYTYNSTLEQTAIDWSNTSKDRGDITHKRNTGDSYYDYNKITSWFKDRGVVCKNIYRVTHTENIGWGSYSCNDSDCTDEFIKGIKDTFLFYMAEKDKEYKAHYQSIMNGYFKEIGIGFAIDNKSNNYNKYYLTVHYCTELVD